MSKDQEPHEYLFSLSNTNKHSAGRKLEPKEQVEFKGTGVVVGEVRDGYASMEQEPTITYKIDHVRLHRACLMDRFEETYDRATRIASEIVRHEWLRSRGEVTPRPADEEVAAAMRAVTSLFKNVSRFLNDDPMEVTDAEVENVEKYLLARARGAAVAARIRSPG